MQLLFFKYLIKNKNKIFYKLLKKIKEDKKKIVIMIIFVF